MANRKAGVGDRLAGEAGGRAEAGRVSEEPSTARGHWGGRPRGAQPGKSLQSSRHQGNGGRARSVSGARSGREVLGLRAGLRAVSPARGWGCAAQEELQLLVSAESTAAGRACVPMEPKPPPSSHPGPLSSVESFHPLFMPLSAGCLLTTSAGGRRPWCVLSLAGSRARFFNLITARSGVEDS